MKKMKKMKKQFLSLFVLLCMIISMFPTTALAANIIDVSGNVTITRSDEELTCADNLYYGEVNVNGSATESKTRLTHPVLPLIQCYHLSSGSMAIIPIRSFLQPINITFTILTIPTISLRGLKAVKDQARFRAGRERINVIRRW